MSESDVALPGKLFAKNIKILIAEFVPAFWFGRLA